MIPPHLSRVLPTQHHRHHRRPRHHSLHLSTGIITLLTLLPARGTGVTALTPECSAAVPPILQHPGLSPFGFCSLPIDDSADNPAAYSPWTHRPVCDVSANDPDVKFCVFTNSRHGRRGLSVLSKPEIAADNVGVLNEFLAFTAGAVGVGGGEEGPFRVVDIPGKGKGVVATRDIKKYELIMADYSVLLVDIAFASDVEAERGYRLLGRAVGQLRDPEAVRTLEASNKLAKDHLENVLRTNAFHTMLGEDAHMALYPVVSRINHACMPNAYTRFDPESLQLVSVAAAKDISAGEEITISYITLGQTSSARKKALQLWGFECQCPLCTAPPDQVAASDARRNQVEQLRSEAIDAFQAGRAFQALRITRQILNLLPQEELFPQYAEHYENMARIYFVLRDQENAVKYAKKSLEVLKEQGYINRIRPEHYQVMWRRFAEEEAGGY